MTEEQLHDFIDQRRELFCDIIAAGILKAKIIQEENKSIERKREIILQMIERLADDKKISLSDENTLSVDCYLANTKNTIDEMFYKVKSIRDNTK